MNHKTWLKIALIELVLLLGVGYYAYKQTTAKNDYATEVLVNTETIARLRGELDSINTILASQMSSNAALQAKLDAEVTQHLADQEAAKHEREKLHSTITVLQTELQPIIDANPKLRALINAYEASEAQADAQIAAVVAERDDWKRKFLVSQEDVKALVVAGIKKDELLKEALDKYEHCNSDLAEAGRTIARQKKTVKVLLTTVAIESGSILAYVGLRTLNILH